MKQHLDSLRKKINETDKKIVKLFEERLNTVSKIAALKKQNNLKVFDPEREKEVIKRAASYLNENSLEKYLTPFMDEMMTQSRQYQIDLIGSPGTVTGENRKFKIKDDSVIGYLGVSGSYSEEAASLYFGDNCKKRSFGHFDEIVSSILKGEIDIGVLPVENSSTGTISKVMDLIGSNDVYITGEHISKISHNLLVLPGTKLTDIKEVYSHHQGLEQSIKYLKQYPWELIEYKSTADSARLVQKLQDKTKAAVASRRCVEIYGLEIAVPDINFENNYTRFVMTGREMIIDENCNKISVVMDIAHKPGALYKVLRLFKDRNINLLKIESRPIIGKPWEYLFYFDFEGNLAEDRVKDLIEYLRNSSGIFKLLGNYPAFSGKALAQQTGM
jgi:chorismate mutase/prephenate dehydratase